MKDIIAKTAWTMTPPAPYSPFHIWFTAIGIVITVFASYEISRKLNKRALYRLLFLCGILLTASEAYKQLFLYYIVSQEVYDWWYFPFQLCSLPMYFCLVLPFVRSEKAQVILCTFMQDFNLLGAVMALAEPSGLMHPYWFLTLHGLIWHIMLIFIGLLIGFSHRGDASIKGYLKTLPLFGFCCLVASVINVMAKPAGQADMFYISPYYPSSQIVFHQIALKFGTHLGNLIYLVAICVGGFLFHMIFSKLLYRRGEKFHS